MILPLARQLHETTICDLAFAADARSTFNIRLQRYRWLDSETGPYLVADLWNFKPEIMRASTLNIPTDVRGQDRIIAIVKALQGTEYLNAPGGRRLYTPQAFERMGIKLRFLLQYQGEWRS